MVPAYGVVVTSLSIDQGARSVIVRSCIDAYPLEGCGLLAAATADTDRITAAYPCRNAAESSRVYSLDPHDFMAAEDQADAAGLAIIGVYHSHTHTEGVPSPTDVAQAPTPDWHYLLVSLAGSEPELRSFRIIDGNIEETPVVSQT